MIIKECTTQKLVFSVEKISGVYFLKLSGQIVYIGKSKNVFSRIFSSHFELKQFDEVEIHWLPESEISAYEKEQITLHKPPLNDLELKNRRNWMANEAKRFTR